MKNPFEKQLEKDRILLYGIMDNSSIKERIAPLYPEQKISEGIDLYQSVKNAVIKQSIEMNESKGASRDFNDLQQALHQLFVKTRKAIRYFYGNDLKTQELLFMNESIPTNYGGWRVLVDQTITVINTIDGLGAKMSVFEINMDDFSASLLKLDELKSKSEKEDGEAQQATQKKNELFTELQGFCSDLRQCLDLFYDGAERQILEEVGITVN